MAAIGVDEGGAENTRIDGKNICSGLPNRRWRAASEAIASVSALA